MRRTGLWFGIAVIALGSPASHTISAFARGGCGIECPEAEAPAYYSCFWFPATMNACPTEDVGTCACQKSGPCATIFKRFGLVVPPYLDVINTGIRPEGSCCVIPFGTCFKFETLPCQQDFVCRTALNQYPCNNTNNPCTVFSEGNLSLPGFWATFPSYSCCYDIF